MSKSFSPHIQTAHSYWKGHLQATDTAVDMTCGNGHDTLYLCELLPHGSVIGFDIQRQAIEKTRELTKDCSNVRLIHGSHTGVDQVSSPRLVVYNLGYLPGGDKSVVTRVESTLESLEKALKILAPDGAISITCYPGHEEGEREEREILKFLQTLPSHRWTVCYHRWINRLKSPTLLWIK